MRTDSPQTIYRQDYTPPSYLVDTVELGFDLDPARTIVASRICMHHNPDSTSRSIELHGEHIELVQVRLNGKVLKPSQYKLTPGMLTIPKAPDDVELDIETILAPQDNTSLSGLYVSNHNFFTQCEAEGFRRITFFPDRPDVMAKYTVMLRADKEQYPVLLSNGNLIEEGDLGDGRHYAKWEDPFKKPSYLFALVAARLVCQEERYTLNSGREVLLQVWVEDGNLDKTDYAMQSLKNSIRWDEERFGLELDLDRFMIVAVGDFNMGAMENKGLNIFNTKYVLANSRVATDVDYAGIEAVVGHEYFHNWTGNRVTCRDWFQLSLKEGFTVYRDQGFSADQGSAAVKRIEDVRGLRAAQFPEDAGPLAHPVRPESYLEISNFYTATIYNKGAELIRMMATILGPKAFRAATDLYFSRFDGTAATCEDFVACMEEASGIDLTQFRLWYSQAGTPRVAASLGHEAGEGRATLRLAQHVPATPGQETKQPMVLPLKIRLFGAETGQPIGPERLVLLDAAASTIVFDGVTERPVLSINRGFSAPVIVESDRSAADLAFLSGHDDDPFARYEAMQQLMLDTLVAGAVEGQADHAAVIAAVADTLGNRDLDPAFIAEAVLLPSESFIGDQLALVDPDAIFAARESLRRVLGTELADVWRHAYEAGPREAYAYTPVAKGLRRLRNVALGYIAASGAEDAASLAFRQFERADNMTDRQGALTTLASGYSDEREAALDIFYNRYAGNSLVIDKWFQTQALASRDDTGRLVEELARHPDFTLANPNRARSLIGAFGANQRAFNAPDGSGYRFLAEQLIQLDKLNPQTAAKLLPPLGRWRRFDSTRSAAMRAALERIVAVPGLSRDLFEQASKSLG